jgi:hypothetical protein
VQVTFLGRPEKMLVPCCGTNFVLREETIVRRTFAKTGLATDASRKEYFSLGEAFAADSRIRQRAIGIVGSMRLFRRFTSSDPREVVARCPASSPVMASPSKKVCGERLVSDAPMSHWEMVTFIAGLRQTGIVAPMPIKGAMNGEDPPGLHRAMFGPNTQFPTPSCRAAVKDGRHASGVVCCNASRPLLDRREHDGMLMCSGLDSHRRKVTLECDR